MWISRKKWDALEKRVADLKGKVQGQLETEITPEMIRQSIQGMDLKVSLCDLGFQKKDHPR
ncbi:MAG: hypothetical protein J6B85_13755 [Lachnospiraceae bacterium]|nr:hypothetical protein [Lachnospiraceae bacterium]